MDHFTIKEWLFFVLAVQIAIGIFVFKIYLINKPPSLSKKADQLLKDNAVIYKKLDQ